MSFFSIFPVTKYTFNNDDDPIVLTHILRRFRFKDKVVANIQVFDNYIVADNETPESVAYSLYGEATYHWIVLLFNDIVDPFTEWVMNQDVFVTHITNNYDDINAVHHYEKNKFRVPQGTEGATVVTNYEYEYRKNEARRKIKVPKKEHLNYILTEVESILKETR